MEFSNYYAILNTEEIDKDAGIQNVPGEKIFVTINDLARLARETEVMKRPAKHKRKRRRKSTMQGVQFTSSPPTIPRASRPSDNFYSSEKYFGLVKRLREYIKIYRVYGKVRAQDYTTRHQMTWESPPVQCIHHTQIEQPLDPHLPNTSPADSSEDNHSIPIIQIDDNDAADMPVANSPHVTRHRLMMERNIGALVRKYFLLMAQGGTSTITMVKSIQSPPIINISLYIRMEIRKK
jgi:hypothetical protein